MPTLELTPVLLAQVGGALLGLYAVTYIVKVLTAPVVQLPYDDLFKMAQKYGSNTDQPLLGKIAIITGSTNGIGEQLAVQLYRMGATVVIASRTLEKCVATAESIRTMFPLSKGKLLTRMLDTSDLDSVVEFVRWFRSHCKSLDFLVNNAGIVYLPADPKPTPERPNATKQGYDKCFATNFLGHFLLTELLLPMLKDTANSRLLNIASSAHLQVDGKALSSSFDPSSKLWSVPVAARSDVFTSTHWITSYANSKLAQLLHMRSIQTSLACGPNKSSGFKVFSVCPGFVATGLVPDNALGRFIAARFYPVEASVNCALYGLFSSNSDVNSGEFLTNFHNFWSSSLIGKMVYKLCSMVGLRSWLVGFVGIPWIVAFQHISYGVHHTAVSDAASDGPLSDSFYQWSLQAVEPYLSKAAPPTTY